jgi:hypothetical protein
MILATLAVIGLQALFIFVMMTIFLIGLPYIWERVFRDRIPEQSQLGSKAYDEPPPGERPTSVATVAEAAPVGSTVMASGAVVADAAVAAPVAPAAADLAQGGEPRRNQPPFIWPAIAAMLLSMGGYVAYHNMQGQPSSSRSPNAAPVASGPPTGYRLDGIDAAMPYGRLWKIVKSEFPDWYSERSREVRRLDSAQTPQNEITQQLAEKLVTLWRQHAKEALSASPGKLVELATALLENVKLASRISAEDCYLLFSKGEMGPSMTQMMRSSLYTAGSHFAVIFESIAEGRGAEKSRLVALKKDYAVIGEQLRKVGWSQRDLQTIGDSKALSKLPAERVCKLVQDWLGAVLTVQPSDVQERLLVETLRPIVSGGAQTR